MGQRLKNEFFLIQVSFPIFPDVKLCFKFEHVHTSHLITQFLRGHGNAAANLHSMALVDSPSCSACGHEYGDVEHALWFGPVLDRDVERLVTRLNENGV